MGSHGEAAGSDQPNLESDASDLLAQGQHGDERMVFDVAGNDSV